MRLSPKSRMIGSLRGGENGHRHKYRGEAPVKREEQSLE